MRRPIITATVATTAATASLGLFAGGAVASATPPRATHTSSAASAKLDLRDAFSVRHKTVDVPGRAMHVTGFVRPYAPHQKVTVSAYLGKKRISEHRVALHATKAGPGRFVETVTAPRAGILHLKVSHPRTPGLAGFHGGRGVEVLSESTQSKLFALLVQQRLARLHIYMPRSGVWDLQTTLAVDAYHRLLGEGPATTLDHATLMALLDGKGSFTVHDPRDGRHAEGDLGSQLLALVDGSKVQRIYPISSGKASTPTILGRYRVYNRVPGYLPDGMYYSDFFIRGYAIHGYDPAPDYPASHGCMRLPISDAISVFDWLALGDVVDVYM